jgi:hypothetical protein
MNQKKCSKKDIAIKTTIIKQKSKSNIDKERDERISKIMENDIIANDKIVDEYNNGKSILIEDTFLKKIEWLSESLENGPTENDVTYNERYSLFMECCEIIENQVLDTHGDDDSSEDEEQVINKETYGKHNLFLYFIALDEDKIFIHTDLKKEHDVIMKECEEEYEYVSKYKPQQITMTMKVTDLYDIDKYVKIFMHMFGIDDTRGGSYTNMELPDHLKEAILHEKNITSFDYYLKKEKK